MSYEYRGLCLNRHINPVMYQHIGMTDSMNVRC